jgi:hypothetical protein
MNNKSIAKPSIALVGLSSNRNRMIAACSVPMGIGHARLFRQQITAVIQSSPLPYVRTLLRHVDGLEYTQ